VTRIHCAASAGGNAPCGTSQPRDHGPGECLGNARHTPSALIAQSGGLAPTRSARTPSVASSL
jgi:hypothetical protein